MPIRLQFILAILSSIAIVIGGCLLYAGSALSQESGHGNVVNCLSHERGVELMGNYSNIEWYQGIDVAKLAMTYAGETGHGLVVADHLAVGTRSGGETGIMFFFRGCAVYSQDLPAGQWSAVVNAALGRGA